MLTLVCCLALCAAQLDGQIAYLSGPDESRLALYLYDCSEGQSRLLAEAPAAGTAAWSPDGQWIAIPCFTSPNTISIQLLNIDTEKTTRPDHHFPVNRQPAWSPDGKRLAYIAQKSPLKSSIVVYDLETNVEFAWGSPDNTVLLQPVWLPTLDLIRSLNPTGELLELAKEAKTSGALFAMGLMPHQGHSTTKMVTEPCLISQTRTIPVLNQMIKESSRFIEWNASPDHKGRRIVFESNDGGDREIFVLSKNGMTNISNHRSADQNPSWSPDHKWIIFESYRADHCGIYRVFPETTIVFQIIADQSHNYWDPSWSPDGHHIACLSDKEGGAGLLICDINGHTVRFIKRPENIIVDPVWRPENGE